MHKLLILLVILLLPIACAKHRSLDEDNWQDKYPKTHYNVDYKIIEVTPALILKQIEEQKQVNNQCYDKVTDDDYTYYVQKNDKLFVKLAVINTALPHETVNNTDLAHILPEPHKSKEEASFFVDNNGNVNLPYAGSVYVEGKPLGEIQSILTNKFKVYFKNPFVEVKLFKVNSQFANLTGEVNNAGKQQIGESPLTILQAISAAGGIKEGGDLHSATLKRKNGQVLRPNLFALLEQGDDSYNHVLQDGDILNIPYTDGNKVFIAGEVNDRKIVTLNSGKMSLTEAFIDGNGAHHYAGDESRIYVIRAHNFGEYTNKNICTASTTNKPAIEVFAIDMYDPQTMALGDRFMLQPRDILYVSTLEISQFNRFMSQLVPQTLLDLAAPVIP